jgi:hypothetical protein
VSVQLKERRDMEKRKPKPFTTKEVSILNPQHIQELMQKYDDQFTENEEYRYKEARMKDEFYGEKVYRYSPAL